jgi:hypothetical protein
MLHIIIKLSIIFIIIFIIKNIHDINKFNLESNIIEIDDTEYIKGKENIQDPLLIKYNINSNITDINTIINENINDFIIENNTLTTFTDLNSQSNIYIQNSSKLYDILNVSSIHKEIFTYFNNMFSFNKKHYASIYKGTNNTPIIKNKHNIHLLICLMGECELFLYNPKHTDILNNKNIKKWSSTININSNNDNIVYIPPNWNYSIETKSDCILSSIDCDNLFTFLYNDYRN